jgi:putative endonuclease
MMQSSSGRTLYIGMTNNLYRRVYRHKTHEFQGFTHDYDAVRLVYWESFAINREKQMKNWRREKKEWLIQRANPDWKDLAEDWYRKPETQGPSTSLRCARDDRAVSDPTVVADSEVATLQKKAS